MQVDYDRATAVFERFGNIDLAPSLHPYYVTGDAKRSADLQPVFFIHEEGPNVYYHAFHVAPVPTTDFFDIQSAYGYGGPVSSTRETTFIDRAWATYLRWCEENNILVEFIRFHPLIGNWSFYQGKVFDDRETVWIDLNADAVPEKYGNRARTAVRKAQNHGLKVEWDERRRFADDFLALYKATMTEMNADDLYYFNDDYFRHLLEWDKTHLAICLSGNEVLAAALFLSYGNTMEYHLSASSPAGKKLAATNLIVHEAALLGQRLGCHYLHLGGGTDNRPDNPLFFFKAGFSSRRGLFKIGKLVHKPDAYDALRSDWLTKQATVSNRILFYRF